MYKKQTCWMNLPCCTTEGKLSKTEKSKITREYQEDVRVSHKKSLCSYHSDFSRGGACFTKGCFQRATTPVEFKARFLRFLFTDEDAQPEDLKTLYCTQCSSRFTRSIISFDKATLLSVIQERNSKATEYPAAAHAAGSTTATVTKLLTCTQCSYRGPELVMLGGRGFASFEPIICRLCSSTNQSAEAIGGVVPVQPSSTPDTHFCKSHNPFCEENSCPDCSPPFP
jgi:hypothetical protein